MTRPRVAPIDVRMATSRPRAAARARRRLATFAQAIRRTKRDGAEQQQQGRPDVLHHLRLQRDDVGAGAGVVDRDIAARGVS